MADRDRPGPALLRKFLDDNDLSRRQMAIALGLSHPAVLDWCEGLKVPSAPHREMIAVWTNGAVPAEVWGQSKKDREQWAKVADVKPYEPPKSDPEKDPESGHHGNGDNGNSGSSAA